MHKLAMSHNFGDPNSSHRKRVVESLTTHLHHLNISLAVNGLSRYKDDLICAKSKGDDTDMHIFSQTINLIDERAHPLCL
jgi:hypothetical protein